MTNEINWNELLQECIHFIQRLVQTPSMPFEEENVAQLIAEEMNRLEFDEVWLDKIGNVYGRIHGQDRAKGALVLNSHTDHVDPGEPSLWPVPPYSAEIVGDRILGRATCDIKGPLAVQVYSMAALKRLGQKPPRDIVFTGVVQEEIGGAGAVFWVENLDYPVDLIVLGEPSSNHISLGHRGLLQMWLTFHGRSVHASVPQKGDNPNYALATFLQRLAQRQTELSAHELLGRTTVAPTIIEVDTKSSNVTPAWSRVFLDFRTSSESPNSLQAFISDLAADLPHTLVDVFPSDPDRPLQDSDEQIYGFYTPPESDAVQRARAAITAGMGWQPDLTSYNFATDGRHFVPYNIPIIGYSPAEEHLAHTIKESISIPMISDSLRGHVELLKRF